ncbi:putative proton-dependent oligopeptide transporter family, MFS transporter superfamily [Helianthus annuus]|nr:putative proton-dependent oligopeptide transporter family, MFS transporter superfamily [Helianthus annuus]
METSVVFTKRDVTCSKKAMKGGWKSAIFIIFVEFGERFAYYGVSGNLITYLTVVLKQPLSTAAKNVNLWHGVSAIFPILGGFLADSFFGRFNTIVFSSLTYLLVILSNYLLLTFFFFFPKVSPPHLNLICFFILTRFYIFIYFL